MRGDVKKAIVQIDVRKAHSSTAPSKSSVLDSDSASGQVDALRIRPTISSRVMILQTGDWSGSLRLNGMWASPGLALPLHAFSNSGAVGFSGSWAAAVELELKLNAGAIVVLLRIGVIGSIMYLESLGDPAELAGRYTKVCGLLKTAGID